jgi:hypothetical protein
LYKGIKDIRKTFSADPDVIPFRVFSERPRKEFDVLDRLLCGNFSGCLGRRLADINVFFQDFMDRLAELHLFRIPWIYLAEFFFRMSLTGKAENLHISGCF